jgi:hypothetical protein
MLFGMSPVSSSIEKRAAFAESLASFLRASGQPEQT